MSEGALHSGQKVVRQLKESLQQLLSLPQSKAFDQSCAEAVSFSDNLEAVFVHGIKIKEFNGVPLWGFLERLEILIPTCIPLRNTVGAVASVPSLRSPMARARAWVRQILNDGHIDEAVMFMMAQSQLVRAFYYPGALLMNPEEGPALIAVLRSSKAAKFNFSIEGDAALNNTPPWLSAAVQHALQPAPVAPRAPSAPASTATAPASSAASSFGSRFDSFMKSFETSLDSLVVKVDAAADLAAKYINEQVQQQGQAGAAPGAAAAGASNAGAGTMAPVLSSLLGTASVGVTRGPGRMAPFFGSTLKELVLDERRTSHAYLNPLLGVPNQAARMIAFISARASTPDLFRRPVPTQVLGALRREVEEEREIPHATDVAAVALLLMQWLNQLPEPLLGYEHYDALLACCELEDEAHRARNMALLVQEASWYAKPLLVRLVGLLHKCVLPEFAAQNNLNVIAVSVLSTPCLLRPYVPALHATPQSFFHEVEARERMQMAATAAGSTAVEFLITNQAAVLCRVHEEIAQRTAALSAKCARIAALQESVRDGVDTMFVDYVEVDKQAAIRELWGLLGLAEQLIQAPLGGSPLPSQGELSDAPQGGLKSSSEQSGDGSSSPGSGADLSLQDILAHGRWATCGFLPAELPLRVFNVPYGSLALKSFTGFMKKYHKQGATIVREFCQQRRGQCSAAQVALQLTKFAVDVLRLLPPAGSAAERDGAGNVVRAPAVTPAQVLARQPSWLLLSEESSFQELFDVAVLTFEDAWKATAEQEGSPPGAQMSGSQRLAQCYSKVFGCLNDIIHKKRARTVEQMWTHWLSARLAEQERLAFAQRPPPVAPLTASASQTFPPAAAAGAQSSAAISAAAVDAAATIVNVVAAITGGAGSAPAAAASTGKGHEGSKTSLPAPSGSQSETFQQSAPTGSSQHEEDQESGVPDTTSAGDDAEWILKALSGEFAESEWESPGSEIGTGAGASAAGASGDGAVTSQGVVRKTAAGVTTQVRGDSGILTPRHMQLLEEALPTTYQCYDWDLVYKLSVDGANVGTLVNKARAHSTVLLVVRDSNGAVFGALVTEHLKMGEREKYYGNGTTAVWALRGDAIKYYPWSFRNSYFLITSKESLAVGGGGSFAIYLDGDLHRGSSGPCQTFSSPCLASEEEFCCQSCEVFALSTAILGL